MKLAWGLLAILVALPAAAQPFRPGEMIRIETASHEVVRGKLIRATRDSLIMSDYARVIALARPQIRSVATYHKDWKRGAKKGARIGAITGAVLTVIGLGFDIRCAIVKDECYPLGAISGIGATFWTTGIGAVVGGFAGPGRWTPRPY
jgi:hypothetical protein